jgi:pimeloyl-ACP methyl ester carboxylesterase
MKTDRVKNIVGSLTVISLLMVLSIIGRAEPQGNGTRIIYRTVTIDGVSIFYREAGRRDAQTLLLLHGFPSSSRMFDPLFERLADQYHLVAPDYPGFGHSDAPDPETFAYTFDHLSEVIDHFTEAVGLHSYVLYVQDYGGPIGFRLAVRHPERLRGLIIQNAVAHEDGLGPLWDQRRAFWKDRSGNEAKLRSNFTSYAATRQRHIGSDPNFDRYDPDLWSDEFCFLSKPGITDIQVDLFYDYQTNVLLYPAWQAWFRKTKPRTLVLWGKYDPSFNVAEVDAEIHILDAGHFALDTEVDQCAELIRSFMHGSLK